MHHATLHDRLDPHTHTASNITCDADTSCGGAKNVVVSPKLLGPHGLPCAETPGSVCGEGSAWCARYGSTRRGMGGPSRRRVGHRVPFTPACGCAVQSRVCCEGGDRHGSPASTARAPFLGRRTRRAACGAQPEGLSRPRGRANHDEHHHFLLCCSRLPDVPAGSRGTPETYSDVHFPWSDVASWRPRGRSVALLL